MTWKWGIMTAPSRDNKNLSIILVDVYVSTKARQDTLCEVWWNRISKSTSSKMWEMSHLLLLLGRMVRHIDTLLIDGLIESACEQKSQKADWKTHKQAWCVLIIRDEFRHHLFFVRYRG
jgi:hypothetical protein